MAYIYGCELVEYFLVKELTTPLYCAIGIRYSALYGAHMIKTAPLLSIDHQQNKLYSLFRVYHIHHLVKDEVYKSLVTSLFNNRILPIGEDEQVSSTISLSLH